MEQRIREGILDSRNQSASKRERKFLRKTARLSLLIIAFAILIVIATGRPRLAHQQLFSSLPKYNQHEWPMKLKSDERESIYLNPAPAALPTSSFQRSFDLRGVQEHLTTIRQDWKIVVNNFMDDTDVSRYSARKIREHFHTDINSVQSTCILVTIRDGNVTFSQKFDDKRHSRTSSLKYILQKIVKEKGKSLAGATFMVMMSDGHRPLVPTFGSARHWKTWKMMIPVPLGNSRGGKAEWGTPFQGWDSYIDRTIVATHGNYSWNYKSEKAVFRGSLSMQKYILGSCNEENSGHCERAKRWNQVNRGVLYEICKEEPDLFDIGFTQHKRKADGPAEQLENAPAIVTPMKFHDFQNYKYVLNVGNNQGKSSTNSHVSPTWEDFLITIIRTETNIS